MREPAFSPSRCPRVGCPRGGTSSSCIPPVAASCQGANPWAVGHRGLCAVGEQQTHLRQLKYTQHQAGLMMLFMPCVDRNVLVRVAVEGGRSEGGWHGMSWCLWVYLCTNQQCGRAMGTLSLQVGEEAAWGHRW